MPTPTLIRIMALVGRPYPLDQNMGDRRGRIEPTSVERSPDSTGHQRGPRHGGQHNIAIIPGSLNIPQYKPPPGNRPWESGNPCRPWFTGRMSASYVTNDSLPFHGKGSSFCK